MHRFFNGTTTSKQQKQSFVSRTQEEEEAVKKADWKRLQNRTGKAFSFFPTLDIHTYQRSWSHSRKNSQSPQFSHTWVFVKTSLSLAAAPSACRGDTWVFFKSYRASRQLFFYHSPIPKCQKILLLVARRRRRRSSKSLKTQRSPKP